MKIIHTADTHLGSALRGLSAEKAELRRAELLDGFKNLCAYARENGVTAVLVSGDLFDESKASRHLRAEVFSAMDAASPVCFFYVSGNHDGDMNIADDLPANLYTFSQNRSWQSYNLPEDITITGIDAKYLTRESYGELVLPHERFNILMLHGEIVRGEGKDGEEISLSALQNKSIDYLALGHIHQPMPQAERLDSRGRYRYSGCPEGRGYDECGKRGVFLLDIQNGRVVNELFLSFARREVCERSADISACSSYYEIERAVQSALSGVRETDMLKLTLCGKHKAGLRKDISLLSARLNGAYFHAKVVDESTAFIDYSAYQNDLSERGEFVREVSRYEVSEEERAEILDVGLKALAGEDIDL